MQQELTVFEAIGSNKVMHFSGGQKSVEEVLKEFQNQLQKPRLSTSRLLANVADLLGCVASGRGGLRSGPAANPRWKDALVQLKVCKTKYNFCTMARTAFHLY